MGRGVNTTKFNKEFILSKVSQITIFSTYLNLSDALVQHCIDTGELIISPLRDDCHPTCGFRYDNKGKLKFKDFAGYFWGDCFDLVALVMNNMYPNMKLNISNKHDFVKVLKHISYTFKDIFYGKEKDINLINEINTTICSIKNTKSKIELVVRDWNKYDIEYWSKMNIPINFLNLNFIHPVDQYYINRNINPEPKYYYDKEDPCYGYVLGRDKNGIYNIKLYFPKRDKNHTKFITNCNHLEGIYNLDKNNYDIIVLTKSTKDRLCIGANIKRLNSLYGGLNKVNIGVINIPHETYKLRQNEYDWLSSKLTEDGIIISLMDNDEVGKNEAAWLQYTYKILPILIPKRYKSKDFAELIINNKDNISYNAIIKCLKYINHYVRERNKFIRNKEESDTAPF